MRNVKRDTVTQEYQDLIPLIVGCNDFSRVKLSTDPYRITKMIANISIPVPPYADHKVRQSLRTYFVLPINWVMSCHEAVKGIQRALKERI